MHPRLLVSLALVVAPLAAQVDAPGGPVPVELLNARRKAVLDSLPAAAMERV